MASWSDGLGRARKRRVRGMLAAVNSAYGHAAVRLADPATRTHGAVGDYPANVASQISAMRALSDRLDRDRVTDRHAESIERWQEMLRRVAILHRYR